MNHAQKWIIYTKDQYLSHFETQFRAIFLHNDVIYCNFLILFWEGGRIIFGIISS